MRIPALFIAAVLLWSGCGQSKEAPPLRLDDTAGSELPPPPDTDRSEPAEPAPDAAASVAEAPPLPEEVDGGVIARPELQAVLEAGIPRFLQQVQTEHVLNAKGRFVGWRLLQLGSDGRFGAGVLKPGDVVMRINGHSIERPEQFKNVWDSVGVSSEMVFQVMRGDQTSKVRYRIE